MIWQICRALVLAIAMLGASLGLANAQNIQSYSITETYNGGSDVFSFSIDLAAPATQFNGMFANFTLLSASYTGTPLGFSFDFSTSLYQQVTFPANSEVVTLEDSTHSNYVSIQLTATFSDPTIASLDGASDRGGSHIGFDNNNTTTAMCSRLPTSAVVLANSANSCSD